MTINRERLGLPPFRITTKQKSSPERLTQCDHPNCPQRTTRATNTPLGIRTLDLHYNTYTSGLLCTNQPFVYCPPPHSNTIANELLRNIRPPPAVCQTAYTISNGNIVLRSTWGNPKPNPNPNPPFVCQTTYTLRNNNIV